MPVKAVPSTAICPPADPKVGFAAPAPAYVSPVPLTTNTLFPLAQLPSVFEAPAQATRKLYPDPDTVRALNCITFAVYPVANSYAMKVLCVLVADIAIVLLT